MKMAAFPASRLSAGAVCACWPITASSLAFSALRATKFMQGERYDWQILSSTPYGRSQGGRVVRLPFPTTRLKAGFGTGSLCSFPDLLRIVELGPQNGRRVDYRGCRELS